MIALIKDHFLAGSVLIAAAGRNVVDFRRAGENGFVDLIIVGRHDNLSACLHLNFLSTKGLHDNNPQAGQGNDDDIKNGQGGGQTGGRAEFVQRDTGEASALAAGRDEKDHEILHGAGQTDAHQEPDEAWQVAKLDGQNRSNQRASTRDCGEVVAEEDPPVGGVIILAVIEFVGGGDSRTVEAGHPDGQKPAVEAKRNGEDSQCADHDPESVGRLIHGRCQ